MAKGKYKARKENRDASKLQDDLARVRAQLAEEEARLAEVQVRAELDGQLRGELAAAIAARDAVCRPQMQRIAADRDVIRAATRQLSDATREIRRHSQKISDWGWEALGPEMFYAVLSGNRVTLTEGVASKRLETPAAEVIQMARGIRTKASLDFTFAQKRALAEATAAATGTVLPDDVTAIDDGDAWDTYTDAIQADSAAVIAFKSPPPWLDIAIDRAHPVSRMLGADPAQTPLTVDVPQTVPSVLELSTGSAALRDSATRAGATTVADAFTESLQHNVNLACRSQIPSMVAGSSSYPAPADASSMHAWYAVSAMGAWGRQRTVANGRVAVAAAAAVPFWLPPGHTIAYLDSEPLVREDVADIRLPFAQVLVTFAEPARLPAVDSGVLANDPRMRWIDHLIALGHGLPDVKDMLIAGTNSLESGFASLWDAIASRGAHIEAVLLLADAHGHLDDLFAWCVAIPSTTAGGVLGRWVIPASRSTTGYANLVTNAAAVAAWADWHRPGHSRSIDEQGVTGDGGGRQKPPEDSVHVLNVTAATAAERQLAGKGEPTGRTTAPHRRRGHWRRQHYGPGRSQTRRIRIAPVMVNAGRLGADRPQIYRLPTPTLVDAAGGVDR